MVKSILDKYDEKYAQELLHFAGGYPDWIWDYHHAGFNIVSNRILEVLEEYITRLNRDGVYYCNKSDTFYQSSLYFKD